MLPLQTSILESVRQMVADVIGFIPSLVGAILILIIGAIIGYLVGGLVRRLVNMIGLDRWASDTPLSDLFDSSDGFSKLVGTVVKYYIYLIAVLAAVDTLGIQILSAWLTEAVSYLPALIGGTLIILVGILVADYVTGHVRQSELAQQTGFGSLIAIGVQVLLYFVVITLGLATMGVDTTILTLLFSTVAATLGLAIAIGVGIALGLGGQDYVAENIDGWLSGVGSEDD